jgi:3-dehydroquinate dehydratase
MKKIIPIRPRSAEELKNFIQKIGTKADIIEIWLDRNAEELIDWIKKFRSNSKQTTDAPKFLGVCKTPEEKGIFLGSMEQKLLVLQKFLDAGGDYVDVDFGRFPEDLTDQLPSKKLWLSWHNFFGLPNDINDIVEKMGKNNPFLIKLAVTCNGDDQLEKFIAFIKKNRSMLHLDQGELPKAEGIESKNTPSSSRASDSITPNFIFTTMGAFGAMGRKILRE